MKTNIENELIESYLEGLNLDFTNIEKEYINKNLCVLTDSEGNEVEIANLFFDVAVSYCGEDPIIYTRREVRENDGTRAIKWVVGNSFQR